MLACALPPLSVPRPARAGRTVAALLAALAVLLAASAAGAAEFYLSGNLGISSVEAEAGGATTFFALSGEDSDSSPAYGGALGFGFTLDEAVPRVGDVTIPPIGLRLEVEGVTGRDYELRTDGGTGFFHEVESWSIMPNLWIDLPVHDPVKRVVGRVPVLEPLFLYAGGGAGTANLSASSTDGFASGEADETNFGWQVGAGVGYAFNDRATFHVGYRFQDLGSVEVPLSFQPGVSFGTQELDLRVDEFSATLRIAFYQTPLENLNPARWKLPDVDAPDWLSRATRWRSAR